MAKHTIATHTKPHLDERFAIVLLKKVNPDLKVVFWKNRNETPDGRSAEEWEADGYILLGVAGGQLDEHQTGKKDRKSGSAISLTCDYLGLNEWPKLKSLVDYIVEVDTNGRAHPFSIHSMINLMNQMDTENAHEKYTQDWTKIACEAFIAEEERQIKAGIKLWDKKNPLVKKYKAEKRKETKSLWENTVANWMKIKSNGKNPAEINELKKIHSFSQSVLKEQILPFTLPVFAHAISKNIGEPAAIVWLFEAIMTKYFEQEKFWKSVDEFHKNAEYHKAKGFKIVTIKSDNSLMSRIARSREIGKSDICVIQQSNSIAIMINNQKPINMIPVLIELRREEHLRRGTKLFEDDPPITGESYKGIWHFLAGTQTILNGSHSCQVDPTKISLEEIMEIIKNHVQIQKDVPTPQRHLRHPRNARAN